MHRTDSTLSCTTSMQVSYGHVTVYRVGRTFSSSFFDGQGVFLSEWDGLTQGINAGPVVVLGATNRPLDLDQVRCCHTLLRIPMILRYNI